MGQVESEHPGSTRPLISGYRLELFSPPCIPGAPIWSARVTLESDIAAVLPYLNARLAGAEYEPAAKVLVWKDQRHKYAFRPLEIKAGPARDRQEAKGLVDRAVALVNDTWRDRERIEARHEKRPVTNLTQIYRLLPGSNCGQCGSGTCMAFAAALRRGDTELACCPVLEEPGHEANRKKLLELLGAAG